MISILHDLTKKNYNVSNIFSPETKLSQCNSMIDTPGNEHNFELLAEKASLLLKTGNEEQSVAIYEGLIKDQQSLYYNKFMPSMALAYMRFGRTR
ncbi:hypothetical protein GCM10023149_01960 [Mucilaginibacter gynuensis]|uniref:Tetratricopeptide repeat protein n=1 Tax=Mucilaginibacter gynuensis TaxID=1302236 RepID=A0ABP8FP89_9SPHI